MLRVLFRSPMLARSLPSRSSITVGYDEAWPARYVDSELGVITSDTNGSSPFSLNSVEGCRLVSTCCPPPAALLNQSTRLYPWL